MSAPTSVQLGKDQQEWLCRHHKIDLTEWRLEMLDAKAGPEWVFVGHGNIADTNRTEARASMLRQNKRKYWPKPETPAT